ncbi:M23 family metallopeptidase [Brevibacillus sp. 7WMA2]|uniref:M23 family metallopeptidase n=1 Tax=Brevibacillus TaxID=55080 RepID=UPI0013A77B09|nr:MULTISPECIES: M23 family metallopeptidase [Brevibacillus]MCR8996859.1 M23 family metallopeptidase [Brevibacillus laterosporus]QIC07433.1 M23 family metallopeptidase [Brevibacillus sp. 7WMA2]WPS88336.1 M23 family metallopeptidase [Brevibacillus halotolerans]
MNMKKKKLIASILAVASILTVISSAHAKVEPNREDPGTYPFKWPVPDSSKINSDFGYRKDPKTGKRVLHAGLDIAPVKRGVSGDKVVVAYHGTVVRSEESSSYGHVVYINHELRRNDWVQTRYAHLRKPANVKKKEEVSKGTKVGEMGDSGEVTGVHLHFETRESSKEPDTSNKSEPVDPLNYVEPPRSLDVISTVDEEGFVPNPYNERYSEETSDQ